MNNAKISLFLKEATLNYHDDIEQSDEHESMHNMTRKRLWLRRGMSALKEVAQKTGTIPVNLHANPSGDIDRGYVSGFFTNPEGTKTVYVSLNDGMHDILYRTAEHAKDYTGGSNNTAGMDEEGIERLCVFIYNHVNQ